MRNYFLNSWLLCDPVSLALAGDQKLGAQKPGTKKAIINRRTATPPQALFGWL